MSIIWDNSGSSQADEEIWRLTHLYAVLSQVNQTIVRIKSHTDLFTEICRVIAEYGGFPLVWIGAPDPQTHQIVPLAQAGQAAAYLKEITVFFDNRPEGHSPAGTALREGISVVANAFDTDPRTEPWRAAICRYGFTASASFPLFCDGAIHAVLTLYSNRRGFFTKAEVQLLEEVAGDISFALSRFSEEARRKQAEQELKRRLFEMEVLHRVASTITEARDLDELIERVTAIIGESLYPTSFGIALLDEKRTTLKYHRSARIMVEIKELHIPVGVGVSGTVAKTGTAWRVADVRRNDVYIDLNPATRSELCVPIKNGDQVIGVINVESTQLDAFTQADEHLLGVVAGELGTAIEKLRLSEAERNRRRELEILTDISLAVRKAENRTEILQAVLDRVINLLEAQAAAIAILDTHNQELVFELARGAWSPVTGLHMPGGVGIGNRVIATQEPFFSEDVRSEPDQYRPDLLGTVQCLLCVPLISNKNVVGLLYIGRDSPVLQADLQLALAVADIAASAIHRAQLLNRLQQANRRLQCAYDRTIQGWSRALELRDQETEGHSRRVTRLTLQLARQMNIPEDDLLFLRWGALLHDIGKMGVPDAILLKPGPLSPEEWDVMRRHPEFAYNLLKPIEYLRPVIDIPYSHHERWDGSGYPLGLQGEEIPLAARIFAVIDVWDALTSDRPYSPAWSKEQAIDYIQAQAGTQFDPRVVQAFTNMMKEKR